MEGLMKNLFLSAFMIAAFANTAHAELKFANSVPANQKKLLAGDMFYMANQPYTPDATLAQLMGISSNDGLTILSWVDNRMSRIVSDDFNLEKSVSVINPSYYPTPAETPTLPTVVKTPGGSGSSVKTIMSNLGGAVYLIGKMQHVMLGVSIDGNTIPVSSPRFGLFKVGEGLFATETLIKSPPDSILSRYFRLSTLVHEARHSDGRGETLGFLHAVCPAGHRYEGYAACDASSNGPYTIEAQFLKVASQSCKECQPGEKEMLNKMIVDSFSRTVAPPPVTVDTQSDSVIISSYQMLLELCKKTPGSCSNEDVQKYQNVIAVAQKELSAAAQGPVAQQAPLWDATPEGAYPTITRDQTWTSIYYLNAAAK
jgi:hypothetical protein